MTINRWHLLVSGKVQGVYYRASTEQKAREWASQAGYEIYRTAGAGGQQSFEGGSFCPLG